MIFCTSQISATEILLDQVMTKQEQKQTGVARLTTPQKIELEAWLNRTFILKEKIRIQSIKLFLSINIDGGKKLELSDHSVWEIAPEDQATASVWLTPSPVKIVLNHDPNYPYSIFNLRSGESVKAKKALAPTPN